MTEKDLKAPEKIVCRQLRVGKIGPPAIEEVENAPPDLASEILSKRKRVQMSEFIDTRFILSTSNIAERFFSQAGIAFGDLLKRLDPVNLEE